MKLKVQFTSLLEAGTDEAGRGCLAGPVTAAAVILPKNIDLPMLNESKKLSEKQRMNLKPLIEKYSITYGVAHVFQDEIDQINILKASIKAMHLALEKLQTKPNYILVDGNYFSRFKDIPYKCVVKGDGKYKNIAAASILAKTYRDEYMNKMSVSFPQYFWNKNKGYATKLHREAIKKYGVTNVHRKSFHLIPRQLKIGFKLDNIF